MPTHEKTDLPRGSETIMVVEDDDALRELIVGMLQGAGYQVIAAKAPETALDILQASKPAIDVLLTDVIMPKRNGSWLAEKTREAYPNLRVLFMSGYAGDLVARGGRAMPENEFLEKPFTRNLLLTKVQSALHSKTAKQFSVWKP